MAIVRVNMHQAKTNDRLPKEAGDAIRRGDTPVWVSAASVGDRHRAGDRQAPGAR
jgi:hypothetical protein